MNHSPESLDMLAFRYLAEELSVAEREQFELQLATDQAAREAVARMVEYSSAIRLAIVSQARELGGVALPQRREEGTSRSAAATAVAIGSSLALLLAIAMWLPPFEVRDGVGESSSSGDSQVTELALAWAETRSQIRSAHEVAVDDEWTAELPEGLSDLDESAEATHFQAPGWMLAAVAGLTDDTALPREVVE